MNSKEQLGQYILARQTQEKSEGKHVYFFAEFGRFSSFLNKSVFAVFVPSCNIIMQADQKVKLLIVKYL